MSLVLMLMVASIGRNIWLSVMVTLTKISIKKKICRSRNHVFAGHRYINFASIEKI